MQAAKKVQAVFPVLVMVLAAGCTATRVYTSKLFPVRTTTVTDSSLAKAPRFLDLETDTARSDWVSTDAIMGRDTASKTAALDKLASIHPPGKNPSDSNTVKLPAKNPPTSEPVARSANPGEIRTKRVREE